MLRLVASGIMTRTTLNLDPSVMRELRRRSEREHKSIGELASQLLGQGGPSLPARAVSVTVDANVLVYASNEADPVHRPARALVERLAAGPEIVYLFWPTVMGYLRIVTHPSVLPHPLAPRDAIANVSSLTGRPHVRTPGEQEGFWDLYLSTRGDTDRGNDVPDGHLAALMRQHGVGTIYTRERDFRRFDGITAEDPFSDRR
jgi:toxin-antitoxin system PIN domain toxin